MVCILKGVYLCVSLLLVLVLVLLVVVVVVVVLVTWERQHTRFDQKKPEPPTPARAPDNQFKQIIVILTELYSKHQFTELPGLGSGAPIPSVTIHLQAWSHSPVDMYNHIYIYIYIYI